MNSVAEVGRARLVTSKIARIVEICTSNQENLHKPLAHSSLGPIQELGSDHQLLKPPNFTALASLLRHHGKASALPDGRLVHKHIIESGYDRKTFLANCLVQMYGDCCRVEDARAVFDKVSKPDLFSWNILITVYGQNGSLEHAWKVFGAMRQRDVVSWNAMLAAFVQNGHGKEALELFHEMQAESIKPNDVTFLSVVDACTSLGALELGRHIHATIADSGYEEHVLVGTALINMYGKCGSLHNARSLFGRLPYRDVICWTAMIGALTQNGCAKEALEVFHQMQSDGVQPNNISFVCVMEACANLAALDDGQEIHAAIQVSRYKGDIKVGNALIDMYSKCGSLEFARNVFRSMGYRTVVSWNAMIAAFGLHGHVKDALAFFSQMQHEGVNPDCITFVAILNACSHTGLVEDGKHFFFSMNRKYGIMHVIEHYVCMIDLLGRAGRLDEAEALIKDTPFENSYVAWLCLLAACRMHGDVERGVRVADLCMKLHPENNAPYVMLSNLYAGEMIVQP